jgi:hypothetical protein
MANGCFSYKWRNTSLYPDIYVIIHKKCDWELCKRKDMQLDSLDNSNNNEFPDNNVSALVIFLITNAFHFE